MLLLNNGGETMKISIALKESIYDCKIEINDSQGSRCYYISALCKDENVIPSINAEVFDEDFDISLIPMIPNTESLLNEFDENNWKDRFAKKAAKLLSASIEKMFLRVGCSYRIVGLQEGDRLDIKLQSYVFGTFDKFDLFELIPMMYAFFEVSNFNTIFKLTDAYGTNRKDVLKFARTFAFANVLGNGLFVLLTYPIQVGRIKRLTKNKKILKVLTKFNNLSDSERQKLLDKQEKFFD